jgi:hypothetical protein
MASLKGGNRNAKMKIQEQYYMHLNIIRCVETVGLSSFRHNEHVSQQ